MTIDMARSILDEHAKKLSNEEIQSIIDSFSSLIEVGFRQFERSQQVRVDTFGYDNGKTNSL